MSTASVNEVVKRMENIQDVFLQTQLFCSTSNDEAALTAWLQNTPAAFCSIAYESASMAIALKDMAVHGLLHNWLHYANGPAKAHLAQVYVGLGWAIAKHKFSFVQVTQQTAADLHHRIADGCGYYDGTFHQRQTILSRQKPAYLPEAFLDMYYQGVGRSLWYSCRADIEKVQKKIESFPAALQPHMWRGMAIAVAYVGGCDDAYLKEILSSAGANGGELARGAALAVNSRMYAGTEAADTDRCASLWLALTTGKATIDDEPTYTIR